MNVPLAENSYSDGIAENADGAISRTVCGMFILYVDTLPENAPSPIAVTGIPAYSDGTVYSGALPV